MNRSQLAGGPELQTRGKLAYRTLSKGTDESLRSRRPIGSCYKAWKSACARAKLPGLLFHDFRRTGVRHLVRAGVPERVAMAISGHRTQAVFKPYNIISGPDLKDVATKLESYLGKQRATKRAAKRRHQNGDNSGTIGKSEPLSGKQDRVN